MTHRQCRQRAGAGGASTSPAIRSTPSRRCRPATRSNAATTSWTATQVSASSRAAERPPRRRAEGDGDRRRSRRGCCWSTGCRRVRDRQSQPRRQRHRGRPRLAQARCGAGARRNIATTASSRPSTASRSQPAFFTVAYMVRAVSPGRYVHPAGAGRGHVPARALRPHAPSARSRWCRRGRERRRWPAHRAGRRRGGAASRRGGRRAAVAGVGGARACGASPRPSGRSTSRRRRKRSTVVLDRDGRLLRPFTTPTGAGACRSAPSDVDPRYLAMLKAYEDARFDGHPGVDPLALAARRAARCCGNGRIVSGGSTLTMQVARLLEPREERSSPRSSARWCAPCNSSAALPRTEILRPLSRAGALRRQSRRAARAASLAYFGREPKRLSFARGGAARGAAAIAGDAPSRPLR